MSRNLSVRRAEHPLATKHGRVITSRLTLYDAIGTENITCWNCGRALDWFGEGGAYLCVDHINEQHKDDRLENLRASCRNCNVNRSKGIDCAKCGERFSRTWGGQTRHSDNDYNRGACR